MGVEPRPAAVAAESESTERRLDRTGRRPPAPGRSLPDQSADHFGGDALCGQSRQLPADSRPGGRTDARCCAGRNPVVGRRVESALLGPRCPVSGRRPAGRLPALALPRVSPLARPFLRPHPRGPVVAGGHRRAGVGGVSAAADGREDRPFARQAQQPRAGHLVRRGRCGSSGPIPNAARRTITRPTASSGCSICNRSTTCLWQRRRRPAVMLPVPSPFGRGLG